MEKKRVLDWEKKARDGACLLTKPRGRAGYLQVIEGNSTLRAAYTAIRTRNRGKSYSF